MQPKASNSKRPPTWARYGVAVGSVLAGWLAREALTPAVGPTALPFIFFFPAAALAAWYGGFKPGALATVLGAATADWFFIEPVHAWPVNRLGDVAALAAFVVSCLFIVGALEAMHRARARLVREVAERQHAERELASARDVLAKTVASIGDAVIVTDEKGNVTFLNPEAERLTGWQNGEANGQPLPRVFHIINEKTRRPAENPVEKVFRTGKVVGLANHTLLVAKDGRETPIDDSAAPIRQPDGPVCGVVLVFRDVTEQRSAQQASERLAVIVEHSGDAIFTKNLDGIIQTWNASAERLFGYRSDEIVGKHVTVLFPPDRLKEEDHIIERLRQGQPSETLETIRVAKNGRQIPVLVSVSPLRNADGELVGASKVIHDITDLVAAREALAREKELLATTLASIGDAVIVTDPEGRVIFLNHEAERLTKWPSSEASGQPLPTVFRIINEETRQPVENPVEKVLRLGGVVGLANHTILIGRDGTELPIDDSAAPIRQPGGQLFGVVLVFRDFSAHKQAEEKLRELALLPAQNPAPILRLARDGTLLHANPAAVELLHDWNLAPGQTTPTEVRALVADALDAGQAAQSDVTVGARSYLVAVVPIPESGYANLYWTEVTERKRAEEALRDAHEQLADRAVHLEKLVDKRTADLRDTAQQLETFSYSIVHDMRAPLRSMRSFASFLETEYRDKIDDTGRNYLQRIMDSASRMDALITDVLTYSRISSGETALTRVNLEKLVTEIVEQYPQFQEAKSAIHIERPLPPVSGNTALLTQVISNLLGNALKFMPPGRAPRVTIHAGDGAGRVRLWVEDNGIGIAPEQREKIFGLFQRLHRPDEFAGTGVGLAIVKKATERMGGRVGVESEPGRGSRFWVELEGARAERA